MLSKRELKKIFSECRSETDNQEGFYILNIIEEKLNSENYDNIINAIKLFNQKFQQKEMKKEIKRMKK